MNLRLRWSTDPYSTRRLAQHTVLLYPSRPKRGFTDKGFMVLMVFNAALFIFMGVMIWRTDDLSPFAYAIPAAAAELAAYSIPMIRKNQAENEIKIRQNTTQEDRYDP